MKAETRILEIGQIEAPAGEIRFLYLAPPDLFARRAERFRTLSHGHALKDYLAFLGLLSDSQQVALNQFPVVPLPDLEEQSICRDHGMPLLAARSWTRNPAWREGLTRILRQMKKASLPPAACETIAGLMQTSETELEEIADSILDGNMAKTPPHVVPFVSAALQVYWVNMASALGYFAFGKQQQYGLCPVCGSSPNAGIVCSGGTEHGLRYLCCSLCSSRWHMVRITCSCCKSTHEITHYTLEGSNGAVKAESCDDCNNYMKLLYLEKDGKMEAMADDLATLALDMLMGQQGKERGGPNLLYHPGRL